MNASGLIFISDKHNEERGVLANVWEHHGGSKGWDISGIRQHSTRPVCIGSNGKNWGLTFARRRMIWKDGSQNMRFEEAQHFQYPLFVKGSVFVGKS
jgi:hypothetical protein